MTAPNISHQSGHARAFIDHDPMSATNVLYVTHEQHVVQFKDGAIYMTPIVEGVIPHSPGHERSFAAWTDMVEDTIVDIFKAIAKALEIYSDEPSQAYKQGFAEGEAKVLREWNESLRG